MICYNLILSLTFVTSAKTLSMLCAKSYPTLCDPMDCISSGSSVHEILQARILEWVAIPFSRGSIYMDRTHVSCVSGIGRQVPLAPAGKPNKDYFQAKS